MNLKATKSSGNVFRDLGFSRGEAEHLLVRSDLRIKLQVLIASRRISQAEVAKILRVTQPRVSDFFEDESICLALTRSSTCSRDWVFA